MSNQLMKFTKMTQYEINVAIQTALDNLVNSNRNLYDYWISELFSDVNGDYLNESAWNEGNVALIEKDVMTVIPTPDCNSTPVSQDELVRLKEQALNLLDKAEDPSWDINDFSIVRKALEALHGKHTHQGC
jgi:hypothetical protein